MARTEVVQNDPYAGVEDVERIFEGRNLTGSNESRIQRMLRDMSERVDKRTNRAWRERRLDDHEARVSFNSRQERGTKSHGGKRWPLRQQDRRGLIQLPNPTIRQFDDIRFILPNGERVIDTATEIGPGKALQIDYERGLIRPDVSLFRRGGRRTRRMNTNVRVKVSYTYGATSPPADVKRAVAQLVAADVVASDQNSTVISGGDDSGMSMAEGARQWRESANSTIDSYRLTRML